MEGYYPRSFIHDKSVVTDTVQMSGSVEYDVALYTYLTRNDPPATRKDERDRLVKETGRSTIVTSDREYVRRSYGYTICILPSIIIRLLAIVRPCSRSCMPRCRSCAEPRYITLAFGHAQFCTCI